MVEYLLVVASATASATATASDEPFPGFAAAVAFAAVVILFAGSKPWFEMGLELSWGQQIRTAA